MKKTLLLSVVASAVVMAGGDIAPVEPAVEAPVVEETASNWDFNGQAVVYYQTTDNGANDLFDKNGATAAAGLQLKAVNDDVAYGIGAGVEVSGISDLYLFPEVVGGFQQTANNQVVASGDIVNSDLTADSGAEITQAYLTYAVDNTSFKLGRQALPKALSPFAFSEGWNVFKNTFDAALAVNTDIEDTTLVYAFVKAANNSLNLGTFAEFNGSDGAHMLTVQNKSIDGLTLTGTYYYLAAQNGGDDTNIFWADAKYALGDYDVAVQGGYVDMETGSTTTKDNTIAAGLQVSSDFDMFKASLAYSYVNKGEAGVFNLGGVKTPLYTQMIANQGVISNDAQYVKVAASTELYDGNVGLAYGMKVTDDAGSDVQPFELDATYSTKVFDESTTLFAGYVLSAKDLDADKSNIVRVWGRYNF